MIGGLLMAAWGRVHRFVGGRCSGWGWVCQEWRQSGTTARCLHLFCGNGPRGCVIRARNRVTPQGFPDTLSTRHSAVSDRRHVCSTQNVVEVLIG